MRAWWACQEAHPALPLLLAPRASPGVLELPREAQGVPCWASPSPHSPLAWAAAAACRREGPWTQRELPGVHPHSQGVPCVPWVPPWGPPVHCPGEPFDPQGAAALAVPRGGALGHLGPQGCGQASPGVASLLPTAVGSPQGRRGDWGGPWGAESWAGRASCRALGGWGAEGPWAVWSKRSGGGPGATHHLALLLPAAPKQPAVLQPPARP